MNFWSVKNVQKYYKSVFINCQEFLCHTALEVLRVHYLNILKKGLMYSPQIFRIALVQKVDTCGLPLTKRFQVSKNC